RVEHHGNDAHTADKDHLPVFGDADDHQPVGEETDHKVTEQGAADVAGTAHQGGTSDHHRSDGGQLVGFTGRGTGSGEGGGQHDSGDCRGDSRDHVDPDLHVAHRHSGKFRGAFVPAGGVQPAAETGSSDSETENQGDRDHDQHTDRDVQDAVAAQTVDTGVAQLG